MAVKRVLIVNGRMHFGGVESVIMNIFRNIDREKIVFDFMLNYSEPGVYDDEIRSMGGKIFILPRLFLRNTFKYISAVNRFFKEHKEYDVVHGNLTSVGVIYLGLAKLHGVKTKIIHAHTTSVRRRPKWVVERALMLPLRFCADYYFACSDAAAEYCFGKKILKKPNYLNVKNGIDVQKYRFDSEIRAEKRAELGIDDKFVIGHVGRFVEPKNHIRMLRIFGKIKKQNKNAVLVLAGDGPLMQNARDEAKKLNVEDSVLFLGMRSDIISLLCAFDVFLLPSLYEGAPLSAIEAQAVGISCVFSEGVGHAVDITPCCEYISLDQSDDVWAEHILLHCGEMPMRDTEKYIVDAGYDVRTQAKALESIYLEKH